MIELIEVCWAKSYKWWSEMIIPSSVQHLISSLSQLCPSCSITISHCESSKPNTESWPVCACWGQFEQVQSAMSNFTLNKNTNLERWVISLTSQPASQPASPVEAEGCQDTDDGTMSAIKSKCCPRPTNTRAACSRLYWSIETMRWPDIIQTQPWSKKPSPGKHVNLSVTLDMLLCVENENQDWPLIGT